MPAPSSSLIDTIGHLTRLAEGSGGDPPGLLAVLAGVTDPRHRRGVRHRLAVILGLAVCAVMEGARSFTAIAEWAADADQATLDAHGVTRAVPSESTFRRTLQRLDADVFEDLAGQWAHQRTAPEQGTRRAIRGHWAIEDRLHWVRDMDFDEDRSQVRTISGPRVMAALRNLAITFLRLAGHASIATALRYHARRPDRPLRTIMKC